LATELNKKIRLMMLEKDLTGSEIARRIGVHRSTVNRTIKGQRRSVRLRRAIARTLHLKVEDLWSPQERESP
jgi:DNA-binding XRE family transcriptional regulator